MAAVLEAAARLLVEAGPRALTVRTIADEAGVNHALAHRHFGTKDEILRQVLEQRSLAVAQVLAAQAGEGRLGVVEAVEALTAQGGYWQMLARAVLDDPALAARGTSATTALFRRALGDDAAGREAAAVAASLLLGWMAFGDFVLDATGAEREAVHEAVVTLMTSVVERPR